MADKDKKDDKELSGKLLKVELARVAIKVALRMKRAKPEQLAKFNAAMLILNHGQGLVGVDDTKAHRLLTTARSLIK